MKLWFTEIITFLTLLKIKTIIHWQNQHFIPVVSSQHTALSEHLSFSPTCLSLLLLVKEYQISGGEKQKIKKAPISGMHLAKIESELLLVLPLFLPYRKLQQWPFLWVIDHSKVSGILKNHNIYLGLHCVTAEGARNCSSLLLTASARLILADW